MDCLFHNPKAHRALAEFLASPRLETAGPVADVLTPQQHTKPCRAFGMLREAPEKWFRDASIEERDRELFNAAPVPFIDYS